MSNDDDLYGDLYGNDDNGDLPGLGDEESEQQETKAAVEPVASSATSSVKPTTAEVKKPVAPATPTIEPPTTTNEAKREQPLTNPIPTFTEDSANSYTSNVGNKYGVPQSNGAGDNRPAQGFQRIPSAADDSHQGIETLGGNDAVRPSNMRDEGKMFVGGLNWDTTDDGLRNYFSQFGKVDACTIMRDPAGRSRGFAFLTFEDPAAVNKVMVQEHYLDGKIIDPKRAIPRTEHQRTVKMFVGGLAPTVTNDSMREYFSQYGKVIDSTVMVDRDSSRSKGFGFVTFDDQSGAERLFGMAGLQIDGKTIEVKMAQPRAGMAADRAANQQQTRGGGYDNHNAYGGGGNSGGSSGGNTPFDPQALATLYQRMAQLAGGQGGMGGWGGMSGGMGMGGNMMGMSGGGMGGGMGMMGGAGGGMGMGGGGPGPGPGMRGGGYNNAGMMNNGMDGGMGGGGGMNGHVGGPGGMRGGNIPRGPAAMRGGAAGGGGGVPTGPSGGLGPARMGRGHQHNYHPYSR